jgi:hypothetical protein
MIYRHDELVSLVQATVLGFFAIVSKMLCAFFACIHHIKDFALWLTTMAQHLSLIFLRTTPIAGTAFNKM